MRYPFASHLVAQVAPELGIVVELEPEFGFAGELIFKDGRRHLFRNTNFNINPAGSTEIAKDKGYTSYFLRKHGFKVPSGRTFFSEELNRNLQSNKRRGISEALTYANELGFPVFAKPNDLSQGILVTKVHTESELEKVAYRIFQKTKVMRVEQPCPGRDYRVVILGQRVISAYERIPLCITGDGYSSVQQLLEHGKDTLDTLGRPNAEIDPTDPRIDMKLNDLKLSRSSILQDKRTVSLLDNANLSTGGTSRDVTDFIHSSFADMAVKCTATLGLRISGVDFLCDDISKDISTQECNIIEVNASPGLDNYASLGDVQLNRVKSLYRQILQYLDAKGSA